MKSNIDAERNKRAPVEVRLRARDQARLASDPSGAQAVRIVVMSDTHNRHERCDLFIPEGDILVHCGDFTNKGDWRGLEKGEVPSSVKRFNEFLETLPHKHKIVIAGNHEIGFNDISRKEIRKLLSNASYLEDQSEKVMGIRFYGTPWTSSSNMGFSARRSKLVEKWKKIPDNVDILISHMPPYGILDLAWQHGRSVPDCAACGGITHENYAHWGCENLLKRVVEEIKPKAHLFGHVHDSSGTHAIDEVTFINAATDLDRRSYVFDYYLPKPLA